MTPEELLALAEKATPGKYRHVPGIFVHYLDDESGDVHLRMQELHPIDGHEVNAESTMAYLAAAANMAPELARKVAELRELLRHVNRCQNCSEWDWNTCETGRVALAEIGVEVVGE